VTEFQPLSTDLNTWVPSRVVALALDLWAENQRLAHDIKDLHEYIRTKWKEELICGNTTEK
jgi:hypothetical protein